MNDIHGEVGIDVERLRAADPDVFHKVVFSEFTKPSFRLSRPLALVAEDALAGVAVRLAELLLVAEPVEVVLQVLGRHAVEAVLNEGRTFQAALTL
ncbi:MAG: hypothetical protein IJF97_01715 [Eggerthellaceae bacterium]|nr:hypothetical protein [Eggerthellaceae bacterium]